MFGSPEDSITTQVQWENRLRRCEVDEMAEDASVKSVKSVKSSESFY